MPTTPDLSPLTDAADHYEDDRPMLERFVDAVDFHRQRLLEGDRPVDLFELLEALRFIRKALGVVERDADRDVALMLRERGGQLDDDGEAVAHLSAKPKRYKWQGHDLLVELSVPLVNPSTGETIDAVPLSLLTEIVPGCASSDQTSARFNVSGLGTILADRFRDELAAEFTAKPGPKGKR